MRTSVGTILQNEFWLPAEAEASFSAGNKRGIQRQSQKAETNTWLKVCTTAD